MHSAGIMRQRGGACHATAGAGEGVRRQAPFGDSPRALPALPTHPACTAAAGMPARHTHMKTCSSARKASLAWATEGKNA